MQLFLKQGTSSCFERPRLASSFALLQQFTQFQSSPVKTAPDSTNWNAESAGNFLVLLPVHLFHDEYGLVLRRKPAQSAADRMLSFSLFEGMARPVALRRIRRLNTTLTAKRCVNTQRRLSFSPLAYGCVHGYPVQPGEEERVPLKAIECLIRVQKRFLHDIASIFGVIHQPGHSPVQPVLVTAD